MLMLSIDLHCAGVFDVLKEVREMRTAKGFTSRSLLILFLPVLLLSGCAPVISKGLREQAAKTLTFEEVFQNPEAYKGEIVIWGGEIVKTTNQKDRMTLLEIVQRPLDWQEEPESAGSSEGRFLVLVEKVLDPHIYRNGRLITVAGQILGEKTQLLGEMEYRYPLLLSKQTYLWRTYPYYYPYPYYPYYPWGYYYPYYRWRWGYYHDPWWGYPYW